MRMIFKFVSLLILFSTSMVLFAQNDVIGQISYLKGTVELVRNGKTITGKSLPIGFQVQNYDEMKVGKDGQAEIKIDNKTGINAELKISPSTIVKLDISSLKKSQTGGIDLLKGNVDLKVSKMVNGNGLNVRTGSSVAGVRGTTFSVSVGPSFEVLIATDEGRVACITDSGKEYYSEPGNVVESTDDNVWSNTPVKTSELSAYRNKWFSQKIDAFKANPQKALKQMAVRYNRFKKALDLAYTNLMKNRDVIKKWMDQDDKGNTGTKIEVMKEKKAVISALFKAKAALFFLEHTHYRIEQINELLAGTQVTGKLDDGTQVSDFLKKYASEAPAIESKINDINYVVKLYAKRNEGTFPGESEDNAEKAEGDDFVNPDNGFMSQ